MIFFDLSFIRLRHQMVHFTDWWKKGLHWDRSPQIYINYRLSTTITTITTTIDMNVLMCHILVKYAEYLKQLEIKLKQGEAEVVPSSSWVKLG